MLLQQRELTPDRVAGGERITDFTCEDAYQHLAQEFLDSHLPLVAVDRQRGNQLSNKLSGGIEVFGRYATAVSMSDKKPATFGDARRLARMCRPCCEQHREGTAGEAKTRVARHDHSGA